MHSFVVGNLLILHDINVTRFRIDFGNIPFNLCQIDYKEITICNEVKLLLEVHIRNISY